MGLAFDTVLIANRGEIACRVIAACRKLGLRPIAIASEADAQALHVQLADAAVVVGGPRPQDSYLAMDAILAAAAATGAQAVHPGYGFLSESPAFAAAVRGAGLAWIGPSPEVIADMGDKARARELAEAAGVPVLPGSRSFGRDGLEGLAEASATIGYPLLVKAAAGGGGIGMRRVDGPEDLAAIAAATQDAAQRLFGSPNVYLERLVARSRHVEVQVFGDGRGGAAHLFERDCSMQRRFQKVIEESPAPGVPPATLEALYGAAVRLAAAQGYAGPGTVEFLVDTADWGFYFLEMNTRIQVEHPVSEMLTGEDLVALQIRQAGGEQIDLGQARFRRAGHAVECRIYAEDPQAGFRPCPGLLEAFRLPAPSEDLRVDTGYRPGDRVTPYYDPLLAKLIVRGPTRDSALDALDAALAHSEIRGITTNAPFLRRMLADPAFRAGDLDTGLLPQAAARFAAETAAGAPA